MLRPPKTGVLHGYVAIFCDGFPGKPLTGALEAVLTTYLPRHAGRGRSPNSHGQPCLHAALSPPCAIDSRACSFRKSLRVSPGAWTTATLSED
eukprot:1225659-Prymnesium_polylepis.1